MKSLYVWFEYVSLVRLSYQLALDDEEHALVWAKITSMFWPARIVRKLGELTEVQLFDEERTKKILQNTKLKPFEKLKKVSSNRSKYWKAAYELALLELD